MLAIPLFRDAFRHETACIIHLASKIEPAWLAWRPTPEQRSTIELLRYLPLTGIGPAKYLLEGSWSYWEARDKELAAMELAEFPDAMAHQQKELEALLAGLSEDDLERRMVKHFDGSDLTLGSGLQRLTLSFLIGYKMQLFLYAKQNGAKLGTSNLWIGGDPPAKAVAG